MSKLPVSAVDGAEIMTKLPIRDVEADEIMTKLPINALMVKTVITTITVQDTAIPSKQAPEHVIFPTNRPKVTRLPAPEWISVDEFTGKAGGNKTGLYIALSATLSVLFCVFCWWFFIKWIRNRQKAKDKARDIEFGKLRERARNEVIRARRSSIQTFLDIQQRAFDREESERRAALTPGHHNNSRVIFDAEDTARGFYQTRPIRAPGRALLAGHNIQQRNVTAGIAEVTAWPTAPVRKHLWMTGARSASLDEACPVSPYSEHASIAIRDSPVFPFGRPWSTEPVPFVASVAGLTGLQRPIDADLQFGR